MESRSAEAKTDGWRRGWLFSAAGAACWWAALPPQDFAPLAWLVGLFWTWASLQEEARRLPLRKLWLVGFVFWCVTLHWLRFPHPATGLGGLVLAAYLACYFPAIFWFTRQLTQWGLPLVLTLSTVFTALEYARAHVLTGFTMANLCHTQYRWTELIQISDLAGGYLVTWLLVFVGSSVGYATWQRLREKSGWWLAAALMAVALTLGYGGRVGDKRLSQQAEKIALIQGSMDSRFDITDWQAQANTILRQHMDLSLQASREHGPLAAIVWPESMFPYPQANLAEDVGTVEQGGWEQPFPLDELRRQIEYQRDYARQMAETLDTEWIFNATRYVYDVSGEEIRYNTVFHVDRSGEIQGHYDKMHLVMFGEYVPGGTWFPAVYSLPGMPLSGGLSSGEQPAVLRIGKAAAAVNICFESILPHLVRRQLRELQAAGESPNLILNVTNDGWFRGSSALDLHFVCSVFRAVEFGRSVLIAANTGFSGEISPYGKIVSRAKRYAPDIVIATPELSTRQTLYLQYGDLFAGLCLLVTLLAVPRALIQRRRDASGI